MTDTAARDATPGEARDTAEPWRDRKRYLWALGLVVPLLPFGARSMVERTGWDGFWWMGPIRILVLVPILDTMFGTDPSNPPESAVPRLEADRFYVEHNRGHHSRVSTPDDPASARLGEPRTWCSTTSNATPTTTPTPPGATSRCATSTTRPSCRPAMRS